MNPILPTFVLASSLCAAGTPAIAEESRIDLPVVDWQQCALPTYPKSALAKDEEGLVLLGVQVDAAGAVLDTRVLLSTGSAALDDATERAFGKCRFAPGTVDGQPTPMWMQIQYFWNLEPSNGKLVARLARAALDGNAAARYLLAAILEIQAENDPARKPPPALLLGAADAGEPMAQIALGAMYEQGKEVAKSMETARRWYALAAAKGNVYAIDHLRFIGAPR
jgi:TonB family protein